MALPEDVQSNHMVGPTVCRCLLQMSLKHPCSRPDFSDRYVSIPSPRTSPISPETHRQPATNLFIPSSVAKVAVTTVP